MKTLKYIKTNGEKCIFENYKINHQGEIFKNDKLLKTQHYDDYDYVSIKNQKIYIQRALASTFDEENYQLNALPKYGKWISDLEKYKEDRKKEISKKQVIQYSKDNKKIKKFDSVIEASKETSVLATDIADCCEGKYLTAGDYIWKYVLNENDKLPYTQCIFLIDIFFNGKNNLYQKINNDNNNIQFYEQKGLFNNYCVKNDIINYFSTKENAFKERIFNECQNFLDIIFDSSGGYSPFFKAIIVTLYKQLESFCKHYKTECSDEHLMEMIQKMYCVSEISQQVAKERLKDCFISECSEKKYSDIKLLKQELQKFIF